MSCKPHEICGSCNHDVGMHVVVCEKGGTPVMECMEGKDEHDLCLCFMDPVSFWKETMVEYRLEKPGRLKEPFT